MINETLTDLTVETLHDLALFAIRATRDAAFDQGKYHNGAKIAQEVKTFAKLRCQLVKRRAGDGDAYEVLISSGGLNVKAEPKPVDGPTVTVDPQLPEHLAPRSVEQRVKAGEPVAITEIIAEQKAKRSSNDAGSIPSFLDRSKKVELDF